MTSLWLADAGLQLGVRLLSGAGPLTMTPMRARTILARRVDGDPVASQVCGEPDMRRGLFVVGTSESPSVTEARLMNDRGALGRNSSAVFLVTLGAAVAQSPAAEQTTARQTTAAGPSRPTETLLSDRQWRDLDQAVDRGLAFLSRQQREDGSFEAPAYAQPAVTSICVMAFLSRGHTPQEGPYAQQLRRAVDFVLAHQQPDGLLFDYSRGARDWGKGTYNHAIAGVMLGEVYGMTDAPQQQRLTVAIEKALDFTRRIQQRPKRYPEDRGGWKYLTVGHRRDADLSVTAWHLMFYRSARNAGFLVPETDVAPALEFVKRCYDPRRGTFQYGLVSHGREQISRAMAGAGILSLSLAGEHHSEMARRTASFVLAHPFDKFNRGGIGNRGRYFYAAYHCSQGMFQLGGKEWAEFYAVLLKALVENQRRDGSWEPDAQNDTALGEIYSTSLAILALTPPYQLLPIYQR